jgi:hypothetical protein
MAEHFHKDWIIQLFPSQENGLWVCPYICGLSDRQRARAHRTVPPGMWDTKEEAEAASLAHAQAWIDARNENV